MTYITIQTDYFNDAIIRKLIKVHGAEIIAVICFFRTKMCQPFGWYCRIDGDNLETLIEDCAYTLKIDEKKVSECYQDLVDKQAFFIINDEDGTYLADTQQLYNFEILNNNRLRDRQRKAAAREAKKEKEEKERAEREKAEQANPVTTSPAPTVPASTSAPVKEEPVEQSALEAPSDNFSGFGIKDDPFVW